MSGAIVWQADAERALEDRAESLTDAEVDHCANLAPYHALKFAARRLSPSRLDDCASRASSAALEFAGDLITPERAERCMEVLCRGRKGLPVDAAGQPISFPTGGFYSVALGDRFWGSKREFVDYVQRNGFVARPDLAMGRKGRNHDGMRNAPGGVARPSHRG